MIGKNGKTAVLSGFNENRMRRWWRAGDVTATGGLVFQKSTMVDLEASNSTDEQLLIKQLTIDIFSLFIMTLIDLILAKSK